MLREEFGTLVKRIELRFENQPLSLQRWVIFYALIGYCVIWWWLAIVLPALAWCLYGIHIGWDEEGVLGLMSAILALSAYLTYRRFQNKLIPPTGVRLLPKEYPYFFQQLNQLSDQFSSRRFDQVWVSVDCNAGVMETGRFMFFGWSKKYLVLGIPIMQVLSYNELYAVLAHEVAHLSNKHSRLNGWLYRLRINWQTTMTHGNGQKPLAKAFWQRFWPKFNAYAFVLSRQHEYQADNLAAQAYGAETLVTALARTRFAGYMCGKFWEQLWTRHQTQSAPPSGTILALCTTLKQPPTPPDLKRWAEEMLSRNTDNLDTHPAFRDRILPLCPRFDPARLELPLRERSAADQIFGEELPALIDKIQQLWVKDSSENWARCYQRNHSLAARLQGIDSAAEASELNADLANERAQVMIQMYGLTAAEPYLRRTLLLRPVNPGANYALGSLLLENGDLSGEQYLCAAIEQDDDYTVRCIETMIGFAIRQGKPERVRELRRSADTYEKNRLKAQKEEFSVSWKNAFCEHELPADIVSRVIGLAVSIPTIRDVRLVRKQMQYSKQNLYVLSVTARGGVDRRITDALSYELALPGRFIVLSSTQERLIAWKVRQIPQSLIYKR